MYSLDLPASDYESVRFNNLCHKMTLHRIYMLYNIFEDGKGHMDFCRVSITIFRQMHIEKPDLVERTHAVATEQH